MATHPFNVHDYDPETEKKGVLAGGSYDNASAVAIACAAYVVAQNYAASTTRAFAVYDDTDTVVAFIGRYLPPEIVTPV
jgi:hypothetical protein